MHLFLLFLKNDQPEQFHIHLFTIFLSIGFTDISKFSLTLILPSSSLFGEFATVFFRSSKKMIQVNCLHDFQPDCFLFCIFSNIFFKSLIFSGMFLLEDLALNLKIMSEIFPFFSQFINHILKMIHGYFLSFSNFPVKYLEELMTVNLLPL